jgi:hypothetical protein
VGLFFLAVHTRNISTLFITREAVGAVRPLCAFELEGAASLWFSRVRVFVRLIHILHEADTIHSILKPMVAQKTKTRTLHKKVEASGTTACSEDCRLEILKVKYSRTNISRASTSSRNAVRNLALLRQRIRPQLKLHDLARRSLPAFKVLRCT